MSNFKASLLETTRPTRAAAPKKDSELTPMLQTLVDEKRDAEIIAYLEIHMLPENSPLHKALAAHKQYCWALIRRNRIKDAMQHFNKQAQPQGLFYRSTDAHLQLVHALKATGRYEEVIQHLKPHVYSEAAQLYGIPSAYRNLCKALFITGKKNEAQKYAMQYVQVGSEQSINQRVDGLGMLFTLFDEKHPLAQAVLESFAEGPSRDKACYRAQEMARRWKKLAPTDNDLSSSAFYPNGSPSKVVAEVAHRPVNGAAARTIYERGVHA